MWTRLFEGQVDWQPVLLALAPTLVLAWLAARITRRLAAAAIRSLLGESLAQSSPLVRGPLRLVSVAVFLLVLAVLMFPAFEIAGLRPRTGVHIQTVAAWAFGSGLRVLFIAFLAYALVRITTLVVTRFEHEVTRGTSVDALERAKRARTLGGLVNHVATVLIVGIAVLMILREFQLDIAPILTGAGIAGLAIGFGAQTLVRDVISGFFMILEDQVRVGDVAVVNGTGGAVEQINLRTIVLRDLEGTVHVIPNGEIKTLANRSKDFSYYVIDLGIDYADDVDQAIEVVQQTAAELRQDPAFAPHILDALEMLGVDDFGASSVSLRFRIKTLPLSQWTVGRELRRRVKKAFDQHGLRIPVPQVEVTLRK